MRRIRASACLATFILVGLANAADHEQKEQAAAAREKSAVLEEKASAEGSKTQPTPAEIITKQQVQSVDLIHGVESFTCSWSSPSLWWRSSLFRVGDEYRHSGLGRRSPPSFPGGHKDVFP